MEINRRRLLQVCAAAGLAVTGFGHSAIAHAGRVVPPHRAGFDDTAPAPIEEMLGRTIQISPYFDYFLGRSLEGVADELYVQGYRTVHVNTGVETYDYAPLAAALRSRGIRVWMLVSGRGTYNTDGWPAEWPTWRMQILKENPANPVASFSLFVAEYQHFKKQSIAEKLRSSKWDGIAIVECGIPSWSGLALKANYGDFHPDALAAFEAEYGMEVPEFLDEASPRYYLTDTDRYADWVQFRADGINRFLDEIVNGAGGIRETDPLIRVATWSLGVNYGADPVAEQKEREGYDGAGMVAAVRPDLHIVQSNWPDWLPANQTPAYVLGYQPFIDEIRAVAPDLPIGTQTDSGSRTDTHRSLAWMNEWEQHAASIGFVTTTAYQYSSLGSTYDTHQELGAWYLGKGGEIILSFTKRLQLEQPAGIVTVNGDRVLSSSEYTIDGSWLIIRRDVIGVDIATLTVSGVLDDPKTRLHPTWGPANPMLETVEITITGTGGLLER